MKDFSEVLHALRKEKRVTQKEIGELLGISERAVRYYETGERRPDFDGLLKLADYFQVSLDYLVGWSEQRQRR